MFFSSSSLSLVSSFFTLGAYVLFILRTFYVFIFAQVYITPGSSGPGSVCYWCRGQEFFSV